MTNAVLVVGTMCWLMGEVGRKVYPETQVLSWVSRDAVSSLPMDLREEGSSQQRHKSGGCAHDWLVDCSIWVANVQRSRAARLPHRWGAAQRAFTDLLRDL